MSSFHFKIMRQKKTRKYFLYTREKKSRKQAVCKSDLMLVLTEDDFKVAIINMFKELKAIIIKEVKEAMMTSLHQTENINKIKITGNMKILEMKSTTEIKNRGLSRFKLAEEIISKLEIINRDYITLATERRKNKDK